MPDLSAVAISGSPSAASRSRVLLEHASATLSTAGVRTTRIDVAALPAAGLLGRERHPEIEAALGAVAAADIVVASTPVYRATFSGLLKVFFDLMRQDAMARKVGVPIATGATPEHRLVLQHGLGPLFASLGAVVVATGIYGTDAQFRDGSAEPSLIERVEQTVAEAVCLARALRPSSASTL